MVLYAHFAIERDSAESVELDGVWYWLLNYQLARDTLTFEFLAYNSTIFQNSSHPATLSE